MRASSMCAACLALTLGLGPGSWAAEPTVPRLVRVEPPRDSGHRIGDVLVYRALVEWPDGWTIDADGLPDDRHAERPIELRSHAIERAEGEGCACRWLTLHWQLFKGPRASEDQRIPAAPVRLRKHTSVVTLQLPASVVAVAPLVPWESRRNWLDSMRPGWRPQPHAVGNRLIEAAQALGLAALAALGWAWASGRLVARREPRPFALARRALRRRPGRSDAPADADDLRIWHRAFDAAAGRTVFADDLGDFFAAQPAFASAAGDVRAVFAASRHGFFGAGDGAPLTVPTRAELVRLLGRLALAEFAAPRRAEAHRA